MRKHKSIRLFEDDRLERLTKVHPSTPLIIFVPVLIWMSFEAHRQNVDTMIHLVYLISGLLAFTLLEYCIHRFLFHFKPMGPKTERLLYLFHGIHHDDPHDPLRLVMPPTVSIPLASLMYLVFANALPGHVMPTFFFGFIFGYLLYDMGHYAFHHLNFKSPVFRYLRKYHYLHHFTEPNKGFGVSSPLWDYVFQTQIIESSEKQKGQKAISDH